MQNRLPLTLPAELCKEFCSRVDWSLPELAAPKAKFDSGDTHAAALVLIRHLRQRPAPNLGYTRQFIARLRSLATPTQLDDAARLVDHALSLDLFHIPHSNALHGCGAESLILAATPERTYRIGKRVLDRNSEWAGTRYVFGETASIAHVIAALWSIDECDDSVFVPLLGWLVAQGAREWQSMSNAAEADLGPSGHNWFAHAYEGLFLTGLYFPEFRGVRRFQALAHEYLDREVNVLFENDGWSKEGAVGYHLFGLSSLLAMAHAAQVNGFPIRAETHGRLKQSAEAAFNMITPDGLFTVFADDTPPGKYTPFSVGERPYSHPADLLRAYVGLFGSRQGKFILESMHPQWKPAFPGLLPLHGQDLLGEYQRVVPQTPPSPDTCLPTSRYFQMRQDWTPNSDFLGIHAGTVGSIVSSHKHVDIFTIEVHPRGRRVIVDNWYGSETAENRGDRRYRTWRIGSSSHNVFTVDNKDQVPIEREYRFGGVVDPMVDSWLSTPDFAYFSAVHEGYRHLEPEVATVRRKIFYRRGRYWIIIDRANAGNLTEHEYTQHFYIGVKSTLLGDGKLVTHGRGGNLLIVPVAGLTGDAKIEPNPFPITGYDNPDHLTYTRKAAAKHVTFATVLIPFEDDRVPEAAVRCIDAHSDERTLNVDEATALEVVIDGQRDVHFDQHTPWVLPWSVGGFTGESRVFNSSCG